MSRAQIRIIISYETDLSDDPEVYEGASTVEERADKESEYINEDFSYMIEGVQSASKVEVAATVTLIKDNDG